jgi:low affinity Fe/Cu permease
MRMMENEDSVVTSLNELRKLKHERITRQTHSRASVGRARAVALAEDPASDQMTPPPAQGLSLVPAQARPGAGFSGAAKSGYAQPAAGFDSYSVPAPAVIQAQNKTSFKAAAAVAVVLIAVGGAGYVKLQNDTQALLQAKDATAKQADEARNKSVEIAAKSEKQSKASLKQCEEKLNANLAAAAAVAPAAASAPVVETKPEKSNEKSNEKSTKASRIAARAASRKAARSTRHTAQADSDAPKSVDIPTIAKKKNLDNDPLSGLGRP